MLFPKRSYKQDSWKNNALSIILILFVFATGRDHNSSTHVITVDLEMDHKLCDTS